MKSISINKIEESDWSLIWKLLEPVFRSGETYAFSPDISEIEAYKVRVENPVATYVAKDNFDNVLGTYFIKPNQPTLGAHVCNCGYRVSQRKRHRLINVSALLATSKTIRFWCHAVQLSSFN